jgi:pimeloyl-ACP methyl ester carboxylesterase
MPGERVTGTAAGVPFVALAPPSGDDAVPVVVIWHMTDPPRSETAMVAALPLDGLDAWRVYLGLPLSGSRLPEGGLEAFFQLGYQDAVLELFDPITRQAVGEFPAAFGELQAELELTDAPLGLVGASAGALVALSVVAETDAPVTAMALVSPAIRLASVMGWNERRFDVEYPWSDVSRAAAERLDFVARAGEIADRDVDTLLVIGEEDDREGIHEPAEALAAALAGDDPERASVVRIPELAHALAEEPGLDPAPQSEPAAHVDRVVAEWFGRRLAPG